MVSMMIVYAGSCSKDTILIAIAMSQRNAAPLTPDYSRIPFIPPYVATIVDNCKSVC